MRDMRCGAKIRSGGACRSRTVGGNQRCRRHGGAPGYGAPKINRNARKHGRFSREAITERGRVAFLSWREAKLWTEIKRVTGIKEAADLELVNEDAA